MAQPVQLEFSVVPDHPKGLTEPVVGLGDFEPQHPGAVVYTEGRSSILSALWVDMISGRPLPTRLVLRRVENIEQLMCLSLFMDREVALSPKLPAIVGSIELARHLHASGLAHIEPDLARLLMFLDVYLFGSSSSPKELSRKLQESLLWVRNYVLQGSLPNMPRPAEPPKVLDQGTNGFVVAETQGRFFDAVVGVYRLGFLRGVMFGPHQSVVCFKKSQYLKFSLEDASWKLNRAEESQGAPPNWTVEGLFLHTPQTSLTRQQILGILLRV